jgi:hypothetical protein
MGKYCASLWDIGVYYTVYRNKHILYHLYQSISVYELKI